MAWSIHIWKTYGFSKANFYLERFVPKRATAHIQDVGKQSDTTCTVSTVLNF